LALPQFILAIDQGTTNTKVVLVDRLGAIRAKASRPLAISFPKPGWVEQDAKLLWNSVTEAIDECVERAGKAEIIAIGVSNQRESVLAWDRRSGVPLGPCVVWQCRRTADFCDELRARGLEPLIRRRSGLPVDPLFSASKIRWLLANIPNGLKRAANGELCVGTVDSWLLWKLSGGSMHATDASNASRTQLLNLRDGQWDNDLLEIFEVPAQCLPTIHPSSVFFAHTVALGRLPAGGAVQSLIGDSHAALFGHGAFDPGAVKATYGTGTSLMTPIVSPIASARGLVTTVAWSEPGHICYALEGNITNTGGAVQWLADFLTVSGNAGEIGAEQIAELAASVPDTGGVYLVPAFGGLGAPHWDTRARGVICGLTRGTRAAHVAKATLDSIAYQVFDVFQALRQDATLSEPTLFVDGGASRNSALMQFQADILACPVIRASSPDLSAIGAAWLAGLAVGYWHSLSELRALPRETTRFEPRMPESQRAELLAGWHQALAKSMSPSSAEVLG